MKILIVNGGRGLLQDPTLVAIEKIEEVFEELHVEVDQIALHEKRKDIKTLPATLKEYDGIILAVTVEWFGIGGDMQTFLDACWYYGNKEIMKELYMMPVVCSTTYGEREAEFHLIKAWDLLGGIQCEGVCAYFPDIVELETSETYLGIIEKRAEHFYRMIKQRKQDLPKSLSMKPTATYESIQVEQEKEQPTFIKDETYIKKQEEDIEELSSFFKQRLVHKDTNIFENLKQTFKESFQGILDFQCSYSIYMTDKSKTLNLVVSRDELLCDYEGQSVGEVNIQTTYDVLSKIINGHMTFQRAFMTGVLAAKGDFKKLYTLDQLFKFK
jgi:multimeric flavodoxin WrbA/putative sterol carrier protein